ncbi:MAG: NAD(P)H-binding protein, partial [SAR324 cluster bacterium]|nr:NAD(P)H-binding protein [SAR324 cluster bacterium]
MSQAVVAIAGATGFVGTAIRNSLLEQFTVRGLTRSAYKLSHPNSNDPVQWVHCNAYSASSVEQALKGADYLVYLIHSMVPSSRLTQASFQDLDLLLADNFAQGAKAAGLKQILYVGGLMPDDEREEASKHLSSRYEVEQVLQASGVPV